MHLLSLLIWGGICFAVAGISAEWAADEVAGWYRTLVVPRIAPPTWVFGPVWTVLYTLMTRVRVASVAHGTFDPAHRGSGPVYGPTGI